nr:integrase, catalytic region, zinc finger, CCHC-type, peptidase aspartic, catalytic [Tanacetum cinerariifolium]
VIQICLWCVDSGCSKHMTGNLKLLINFIWKFMGTFRFRNDHVADIWVLGSFVIRIKRSHLEEMLVSSETWKELILLKGDRSTNLYTINLYEMASASPICLMARTSSTKSWLWHQRLSYLNFDTINDLAKNDLVACLPKFKYHKEHLCPSCEQGKSKRASHPPKPRLHLLHMDLCGPMRIPSINEKRYVLVIVDDYSRYTWVHFLRSKDEAPEVIIKFLKRIMVLLQYPVIIIRTDNITEFKNQVLKEYFDTVGISHRLEAIATACFTQNAPLFTNDREDIGKLGAKGDIGFFIGYSADSCAYRVYNRRTKKIMKTMNVSFDELLAMAFEQRMSKPGLNSMTFGHISSGLDLTNALSTIKTQQTSKGELDLLFEAMYDDYFGGQTSATMRTVPPAQEPQDVDELNPNAMVDDNTFVNPFANSSTSAAVASSSQNVDPSNMHTFYQPYPHEFQWTKDHPMEQVIGEPSRPVMIRNQIRSDGDMCMYALTVSTLEPKTVKEAMTDPAWIDSMQEELLQFKRLDVWVVYFVEGLGHNLFLIGQLCDLDLEVAFRRNACFVRNLEGVDLLKGDRSTNLYTINLHEMASASPICLMARASSTKSWLWHQRLSHLNFNTINDLSKNDLVAGFPKFKYHKEHLCPSCEQGKSKRASHPPKPIPNSRQRLHLLHMDLYGPM